MAALSGLFWRRPPSKSMKFPRGRRLTRRAEFERVRREGKSVHGRFLVLSYLAGLSGEEACRLGIITSKRVGGAVLRNRVRRRLRGIAQRTGERFRPGAWLVLIARAAAAEASSQQLEKEWKWLMHRSDLMLPRPREISDR